MTTPQKILKDYLKGVSKVLDSNPPEEEIKEITLELVRRMNRQFV